LKSPGVSLRHDVRLIPVGSLAVQLIALTTKEKKMDRAQASVDSQIQTEIGAFDRELVDVSDLQLSLVGGGIADTIPV